MFAKQKKTERSTIYYLCERAWLFNSASACLYSSLAFSFAAGLWRKKASRTPCFLRFQELLLQEVQGYGASLGAGEKSSAGGGKRVDADLIKVRVCSKRTVPIS